MRYEHIGLVVPYCGDQLVLSWIQVLQEPYSEQSSSPLRLLLGEFPSLVESHMPSVEHLQ